MSRLSFANAPRVPFTSFGRLLDKARRDAAKLDARGALVIVDRSFRCASRPVFTDADLEFLEREALAEDALVAGLYSAPVSPEDLFLDLAAAVQEIQSNEQQ